jgi:hypothetical protein
LCGWLGCGKEFKKKELLLIKDNIGSESDMFPLGRCDGIPWLLNGV